MNIYTIERVSFDYYTFSDLQFVGTKEKVDKWLSDEDEYPVLWEDSRDYEATEVMRDELEDTTYYSVTLWVVE
jgi:hypothetical protein